MKNPFASPACICKHSRKQHVSPWDWDSDFGDPEHVSPDYKKPYTCRLCLCRRFIEQAS